MRTTKSRVRARRRPPAVDQLPARLNHDLIEIRHLRYLVAVVEAGSITRAADRLGLSQPNISSQIRGLEEALQVELLQRKGKRIFLTSVGHTLLRYARSILRQLEDFHRELDLDPAEMRGVLRLGVVPSLNIALIPLLLGKFVVTHPGVSLSVEEISSTGIETALEEGRMDVGLGLLPRHSPNLHYERLRTDQFVFVVPRSHPWVKRPFVSVKELHGERILELPESFVLRRMTDAICRQHQVRPRIVAEINAIETLLQSLAPLGAAALLPGFAIHGSRDLIAIPLRGRGLSLEIGLLSLMNFGGSRLVEEFARLARATVLQVWAELPAPTRGGQARPRRKMLGDS
ncbi:MAG: LysR family transcriptional regulator [Chthoniobacterales bacterium]